MYGCKQLLYAVARIAALYAMAFNRIHDPLLAGITPDNKEQDPSGY